MTKKNKDYSMEDIDKISRKYKVNEKIYREQLRPVLEYIMTKSTNPAKLALYTRLSDIYKTLKNKESNYENKSNMFDGRILYFTNHLNKYQIRLEDNIRILEKGEDEDLPDNISKIGYPDINYILSDFNKMMRDYILDDEETIPIR